MAKRTKRRNDRYSHKRNSRGKRVSKRRRRVSKRRRRVSNKTYKHKNMRGGMEGRNAGMTDEEAAIRESQGEAGAGVKPISGSEIIYRILKEANLLEYYRRIVDEEYDDSMIEDSDFLDALRVSLRDIVPSGKGGHLTKIIYAFNRYNKEKARVAGGPSPRPAPVSGSGASFQPATVAQPEPVALAQPMAVAQPMGYGPPMPMAVAQPMGYGPPMPMAVAQAYTPPDPALVDIIRRNMVTPAAAAGGFGAQSAKCDHCKSNLKTPGYSYCSHSCGMAAKSAGGFGASALPAGSGAYAPSYQPAPAQVAAPESQTITLTNKVTARHENGKYKMDIPPSSQITIYFGKSRRGKINQKTIEAVRQDGSKRGGLHYRVNHGSHWSWVSEYDLNRAGAALGAAALGATALGAPVAGGMGAATAPATICFYEKYNSYYEFTNYFSRNQLFVGDHTGPHGVKKPWKTTEHYFQVYKFLHSNANVDALYTEAHSKEAGNEWRNKIGPRWAEAITNRDPSKGPLGDTGTDGNTVSINNAYWHGPQGGGGPCEPGKLRAMYNAVKMKFTQNHDLRKKLINTGNAILVENAGGNDNYWGDGSFKIRGGVTQWDLSKIGDDRGKNRLGLLLMQIRDEFTGQTTCPAGRDSKVNTDPSYDSSTGYFNLNHWPC